MNAGQSPISLPRHPSLSPDGALLAFGYAGDIWVVPTIGGNALRLTIHPAYEHSPHFSPDGRWIAFSGGRSGDDDIFVVAADGGTPRQLTFLDADDQVCDWSPDGKNILFSSRRDDYYPDLDVLYTVPVEGGEPIPVESAFGTEAKFDAAGNTVLLTRLGGQWFRKGYSSSGAPQVWMFNIETFAYLPVSDTSTHLTGSDYRQPASRWPLWSANGYPIVVSEKNGTPNLFEQQDNGSWKALTDYKDDGVRFPTISQSTGSIAFEQGTDIWLLRPGSSPAKIEIFAANDDLTQNLLKRHYSDNAGKVAFSTDAKQIFLEIRGDIFASRITGDDDKAARGRANNLSRDNPARETEFAVSSGGDSLLIVSDRNGSRDIFFVTSNDPSTTELSRALELKWTPLIATSEEEYSPKFSPDGKLVAFRRGLGGLVIYDLAKGSEFELLKGWSLNQFAWSPDSKWIAFSREDDEFNSEIYLVPTEGGTEVNISRHPDEDEQPCWSGDGSKLAFRSKRRENNWDIYFVQLRLEDFQKTAADRAEEIRSKANKKEKTDKKDDSKDEKKADKDNAAIKVLIDTTDIHKRIRALTSLPGEESRPVFSPDGDKVAFTSNHEGETDLYIIKWTGEGQKRLTNGNANPSFIDFESSGKRVRYLDGNGRVKSIDADGGSSKDHAFDARVIIDRLSERAFKFEETWRGLNNQFYDPDFHKKDWNALRDKYRPWALAASSEDDFGDMVNVMLGELNASHMGYSSPHDGRDKSTGVLGLDLDYNSTGEGWLVKNVVAGSPCDRLANKILPGDRLLSVAGINLAPQVSLEKILRDQVGQRIELKVKRGKDEKRFIVTPTHRGELGDLRYNQWVEDRFNLVDSLSNGQIGYIHVRGMGEESLARFETELYSVGNGKSGLIIDVRNNGGGWTTDWLLAMLQVKRHAVTFPRGGGPGYPQDRLPLYAWTKPIVTLCNERSFSNAEIFSHAIKTLKRGTLIGVPTPGGVISTGGEGLVDGSYYRIPLRGWYSPDTQERNPAKSLEGNGAVPDIIVPLLPGEVTAASDRQLIKAVEVLTAQLKADKN